MAQLLACDGDYSQIHAEQAARRLAWWETNKDRLTLSGPLPRQAYTLFLLCYLGLDPREVPVVYEDQRKITWRWRSYNLCSLLEACVRLGLDTREVCRHGSEESVQVLIARLNSRLRFSRNYVDGIRPYADYCEETIELSS
jgi:tRNA(adenine34) deaminase